MVVPVRRDAIALLALAGLAVALTFGRWGNPPQWKPDALFYEAQLLEIRGVPKAEALHRVFTGPLAAPRREDEAQKAPEQKPRVSDPAWVTYSAQFYRRRWVVPILGAAIEPVFGTNSLQIVSLTGFALVGPLLYLLLRRRFGRLPSVLAAGACVALPPLRYWAEMPQTDSFAVAMEALALLAAMLALERGRRWYPFFLLSMLLLAFTRDASAIVLVAVAWLALRTRSTRSYVLVAGAAVATALPPLFFGAPLRVSLAYMFDNFYIPSDTSWGFVLGQYPKGFRRVEIQDVDYLTHHPLTGLAVVGGLLALYALRRRDPLVMLGRAAGIACLGLVALQPNPTGLRLELVFIPVLAVGLALLLATVLPLVAPTTTRVMRRRAGSLA
jgi:hypothetical protein